MLFKAYRLSVLRCIRSGDLITMMTSVNNLYGVLESYYESS